MARKDDENVPETDSIRRRDFIRKAAVGTAGVGALAACGDGGGGAVPGEENSVQGPQVSWRLATSFPPSLDILHGSAERMAERISSITGGRFQIRVYAANEIVPGLQVMPAVQQGTVQAGLTPSYYYIGMNPALAFDTAVPFGFNTRQHSAWLYHGGGLEMIRDI
jgi:TRAP-type mannitol/chloroaromatic compound transport system substrate-binding protein